MSNDSSEERGAENKVRLLVLKSSCKSEDSRVAHYNSLKVMPCAQEPSSIDIDSWMRLMSLYSAVILRL